MSQDIVKCCQLKHCQLHRPFALLLPPAPCLVAHPARIAVRKMMARRNRKSHRPPPPVEMQAMAHPANAAASQQAPHMMMDT